MQEIINIILSYLIGSISGSMVLGYLKGIDIRKGLEKASYEKIIISDGDMELDPKEINTLMILDKENDVHCVFGSRYKTIHPFTSFWDFGNFFFTGLFNVLNGSQHSDALCCAKAFYKDDLNQKKIYANGFDIDVEIAVALTKNTKTTENTNVPKKKRKRQKQK